MECLAKCLAPPSASRKPAAPAAAASPPPVCCWLTWTSSSNGALIVVWSAEPVADALAVIAPKEEVPKHYVKTNCGRRELCRKAGGPNQAAFFSGWVSFLGIWAKFGGLLTLLTNLDSRPVTLIASLRDTRIVRMGVGEASGCNKMIFSQDLAAVACVPFACVVFDDVQTLPLRTFIRSGERVGATRAFDGGGGDADTLPPFSPGFSPTRELRDPEPNAIQGRAPRKLELHDADVQGEVEVEKEGEVDVEKDDELFDVQGEVEVEKEGEVDVEKDDELFQDDELFRFPSREIAE